MESGASIETLTGADAEAPLPPALAVLPGPAAGAADSQGAQIRARRAALAAADPRVLVAHAALTARRLGLAPPPRSPHLLDALELFAFVRPAPVLRPLGGGPGPGAGPGRAQGRGGPGARRCATPPPRCWPSWPTAP